MNPVKKKNVKLNAELKTISDYALILQHLNGFEKLESMKAAKKSLGEPLYEALLKNNILLFETGDIQIN